MMEEQIPIYIGHHDSNRSLPITFETISQAHSSNYDMVTCPITTQHFHSRVLALLSSSLESSSTNADTDWFGSASSFVIPPLNPEDSSLTPTESTGQIVGITSKWIDLSSPDPVIAEISRQVLKLELNYAAFCGISHVVIHGSNLRNGCDVNHFARAILDGLSQNLYLHLHIWLPMIEDMNNKNGDIGDLSSFSRAQLYPGETNSMESTLFRTWRAWDTIRNLCKYSTRLCVALSLPKVLPPGVIQSRWYSEPIRIITLGAEAFANNAKGYPALPKSHQAFILRFLGLKPIPWFLLCDVDSIGDSNTKNFFPTIAETTDMDTSRGSNPYIAYMRNLQTKTIAQSPLDRFGEGYQDYLQAPLQPLTVNLESITYEVFEKDPIKYAWYEKAIARALHDWVEQGKPTSNPDGRVVVAVVGAGRGPLVTRALKAGEDVGVDIDMWAVEKNPNAFVLLQRHNESLWQNKVTLVKSDMRSWLGPISSTDPSKVRKTFNIDTEDMPIDTNLSHSKEFGEVSKSSSVHPTVYQNGEVTRNFHYKIDILISELLGSFGDNELSPECLDGVQHLLNPTHGISIPRSYTAHLAPISAPKLHADISLNISGTAPEAAEIPYVVMLNAFDFLSKTDQPSSTTKSTGNAQENRDMSIPDIKTAWSFHHPNPTLADNEMGLSKSQNSHNARYANLSFPVPNEGVCHGLGGYFETVLYPGVELSTNPNTIDDKSEGMISWFPIYFPLKIPLYLPPSSEVNVSMWRQTDDHKVWYEWIIDVFLLQLNAENVRSRVKVGSSQLHSSEKQACLM